MLRKLRFFIRKYLGFSKTEANGFIILVPLMILLVLGPSILKEVLIRTSPPDNERDIQLLREWIAEVESTIQKESVPSHEPMTFNFDPNTCTARKLEQLGFSKTSAERISKYRSAGGRFNKKEDLLKIYGISQSRVQELWNYINIRKTTRKTRNSTNVTRKIQSNKLIRPVVKMPLNPASADSIRKIRGIGPVLSKRITKYRDRLGGFVEKSQLSEVYGLKSDVQAKLWEYFELDSMNIQSLDINSGADSVLWKHPYISYNQAKAIVAFRDQHGPYKTWGQLRKVKILDDSTIQKITPYLRFE